MPHTHTHQHQACPPPGAHRTRAGPALRGLLSLWPALPMACPLPVARPPRGRLSPWLPLSVACPIRGRLPPWPALPVSRPPRGRLSPWPALPMARSRCSACATVGAGLRRHREVLFAVPPSAQACPTLCPRGPHLPVSSVHTDSV